MGYAGNYHNGLIRTRDLRQAPISSQLRGVIVRRSHADAVGHQEEFPGQRVQGDWDAEAWQMTRIELTREGFFEGLNDSIIDDLGVFYSDCLRKSVDLMVGQVQGTA